MSNFDTNILKSYVQGTLDADERSRLAKEAKESNLLQKELLYTILEERALETSKEKEIRMLLTSIRNATPALEKPAPLVKPLWKRAWAQAASLAVLLIAGLWVYSQVQYSNTSLVTNAYWEAASPTTAGSPNEEAIALADGLVALYSEQDYAKASRFFDIIPSTSVLYHRSQYYLAHTLLLQKNYAKALTILNTLPAEVDRVNGDERAWLQLLCELGTNQMDVVKQKLDTWTTPDTPSSNAKDGSLNPETETSPELRQKAMDLKKKLQSPWRKVILR